MLRISNKAQAAAACSAVVLLGTLAFWALLAAGLARGQGLGDMGGLLVIWTGLATVINISAVVMLAIPAVTGHWVAHQRPLALAGAACMAALLLFDGVLDFLLVWAAISGDLVARLLVILVVTYLAIPLGITFARATADAAGNGRQTPSRMTVSA